MVTGGERLSAGAGGILSYFTRHRTAANLLLVVMLTAGLFAFPNMRAQFFPDVVVDDLTVSVTWDGAGAEDVDAAIVQVREPGLRWALISWAALPTSLQRGSLPKVSPK